MTVPTDEASTGLLPGNGASTEWPFGFPVPSAAEIRVLRYTEAGAEVEVPQDAYAVELVERGRGGGIVTYPLDGSQVPEGESVAIERDPSFLQPLLLRDQTRFPAAEVERGLDRATHRDQWLRERVRRTPQLPAGFRPAGYGAPIDTQLLRWELQPNGSWLIGNVAAGGNVSLNDAGFVSARDIGLKLDGTSDDSVELNKEIARLSAAGGGTIWLADEQGGALYLAGDINVRSGVSLLLSVPVVVAPGVGIKAAGSLAMRSGADALRLVTDATAGATTITVDTAASGGGALSSFFAAGTRIRIEGLRAGSGTPIEREFNTVTAVNDGTRTLTLLYPLAHAYKVAYPQGDYELQQGQPNRGLIAVPKQALLAGDAAAGSASLTLGAGASDIGLFDWVIVGDERKTGSGVDTHVEIAQVVDIQGAVVTLNRKVRRQYLAASRARVTVMNPVVQATVQGASVTFRGVAGPDIGATFNIAYAVDCVFADCTVPNTDQVGSRDAMFRCDYAYNSGFTSPNGRNPKFLAAGEGWGVVFAYSTRCYASAPSLSGCRHDVSYVSSTECIARDVESDDNRLTAIDFHGSNSVGCGATIANLSYAGRTASASNGAIIFGNPSHDAGDHECFVMGGDIGPYAGNAGVYACQVVPPSSRCYWIGTKCHDVEKALIVRDVAGRADLIARDFTMMDVQVDGCVGHVVDVQCNLGGSTAKNLDGLFLIGVKGRSLQRGLFIRQANRVRFDDCLFVAGASPDAGAAYSLYLNDITALRAARSAMVGFISGAQVTACPAHRFQRVDFEDLTGPTVLNDVSGNAGSQWRYCDAPGAVTGAPTIVHHPRGRNRISVAETGARGDGATNDQPAFQAAIDRVQALGGGIVDVPAGTYLLNTTALVTASNVTIEGAGSSQTLILNGSTNSPSIRFDGATNLDRVAVVGLQFASKAGVVGVVGQCAVRMVDCYKSRAEDLETVAFPAKLYDGFRFEGCHALKGEWLAGSDTLHDGCSVKDALDLYLDQSRFDANGQLGLYVVDSEGLQVSNTTMYGNALHAADFQAGGDADNANFFFLNVIFDTSGSHNANITNLRSGRFVQCWFSAQIAEGTNPLAVGARLAGPAVKGLKFIGCSFLANNGHGAEVVTASGSPDDIEFTACEFGSDTFAGIGNGKGTPGLVGYGLAIADGATDVRVLGGSAKGNASGAVLPGTGGPKIVGLAGYAGPSVTGSRGGNAAVQSALAQLAALGLITDNTTA